jgi:hypothetical protein
MCVWLCVLCRAFGNDRRIECEACNYVLYMLIDRLGDQFSRVTIEKESELLCPRVQWGT